MIKVRTLGVAEVAVGRRKLTPRTEVMFAVALYLGVRAGERHGRDDLVSLLWPGKDLTKSRHALRQMMYRLRQIGLRLDETAADVCLPSEEVACDLRAVLEPTWPEQADGADVLAAAQCLPGFAPRFSGEYSAWLDELRARVAAQVRRAGVRQIQNARREGRWMDSDRWGRVVLEADPLNEEATLARVECAMMLGSKAAAFEILEEYLKELGDKSRQIGLPATLLKRRISDSRNSWEPRGRKSLPLIGRTSEMSRLTAHLAQAQRGSGAALALIGAPGIGKTRLAEELRRFAELEGARSLSVQCSSADRGRPYSVGTRLATSLLETPGVAGCAPAAYALLKRIGAAGFAVSPLDGLAAQSLTPDAFSWTLSEAVSAASSERTLVIVIEDLHHCDEDSLSVLSALGAAIRSVRSLLLATTRPLGAAGTRGSHVVSSVLLPLHIGPLSTPSSHALLEELSLTAPHELPEASRSSLVAAAGGNPLFLRELVTQRLTDPSLTNIPKTLQDLIVERSASFSAEELTLLQLATLLGPLATVGRLRQALRNRVEALPAILAQLVGEGILGAPSPGRVSVHECWQQELRSGLSDALLAPLAIECAEVLLASDDPEDALDVGWRAAELFETAGERSRARRCYASVGEQLMQRGNPRAAAVAFSNALALAPEPSAQLSLSVQLASAIHGSNDFTSAVEFCRRTLALAQPGQPGAASARALLLALLADAELKCGLEHAETLESLASAIGDPNADDSVRQEASMYALRLVYTDFNAPVALELIQAARDAASRGGLTAFGALAEVIWASECGSAADVRRAERQFRTARTEHLAPVVQSMSMRMRGQSLRFLGDIESARERFESAIAIAKSHGLERELLSTRLAVAFMLLDSGSIEDARALITEIKSRTATQHGYDLARSVLHAEGRLLLLEGDHSGVLALYEPFLEALMEDTARRRRVQDLACIALSAARTGRGGIAADAAERVTSFISGEPAGPQLDFAANCLVEYLEIAEGTTRATAFGIDYQARRAALSDRPVAASLERLHALVRDQPSAQGAPPSADSPPREP